MSATVVDGSAIAAEVRAGVKADVEAFAARHDRAPALATILVGEDPASRVYVASKHRACRALGIGSADIELDGSTGPTELMERIASLNADDAVDAILVQLPLPPHLDAQAIVATIDPAKDVDGLTPVNLGLLMLGKPGLRACTPSGVMELLRRIATRIEGSQAVVVGRSALVGKPLALMLMQANATVTVCHSRTRALSEVTRMADILVVAAGRRGIVTGDMVKDGATVIDVGVNRTEAGLVGDVDFDSVVERAGAITPVPGGVGPMTIAMLVRNTVEAASVRSASTLVGRA